MLKPNMKKEKVILLKLFLGRGDLIKVADKLNLTKEFISEVLNMRKGRQSSRVVQGLLEQASENIDVMKEQIKYDPQSRTLVEAWKKLDMEKPEE